MWYVVDESNEQCVRTISTAEITEPSETRCDCMVVCFSSVFFLRVLLLLLLFDGALLIAAVCWFNWLCWYSGQQRWTAAKFMFEQVIAGMDARSFEIKKMYFEKESVLCLVWSCTKRCSRLVVVSRFEISKNSFIRSECDTKLQSQRWIQSIFFCCRLSFAICKLFDPNFHYQITMKYALVAVGFFSTIFLCLKRTFCLRDGVWIEKFNCHKRSWDVGRASARFS